MRKCVGVLLVLSLVASSAFATNSWNSKTGSWSDTTGWSRGFVPVDTEQIKIYGGWTCNLDSAAGTFGVTTTNKITVGTSTTWAYLNVKPGGSITSGTEIQDGGDAATGKYGAIVQTGGTVTLTPNGTKDSKLEVGYKGSQGAYTISGGTLAGASGSQLLLGASGSANGGIGSFTVQGGLASITVGKLYVGVQDSAASYTGEGDLEFDIMSGAISAINAGSVYIDPTNLSAAIANLTVNVTGALPSGNIVLINNTGASAVSGAFDNHAWNSTMVIGGVTYTLVNNYANGVDGLTNDVALIIPEPATITLLGLGLLAIRRNKK